MPEREKQLLDNIVPAITCRRFSALEEDHAQDYHNHLLIDLRWFHSMFQQNSHKEM